MNNHISATIALHDHTVSLIALCLAGLCCYQLYGMIFRPALTGHALTGLVIINGKSKGDGAQLTVFCLIQDFWNSSMSEDGFPSSDHRHVKKDAGIWCV